MTFIRASRIPPSAAALVSVIGLAGALQAQTGSTLPPTAPTRLATAGSIAPLAAAGTTADRVGNQHHRAQVTCTGGQIAVRADNSSLSGILRAIANCTGMRITGGVEDQRVFGNYGPAAPATILATLLDGTGSNMLLQETAADQPAVLILTPRTGGPTPPSPTAAADEEAESAATAPAPGRAMQPGAAGSANTGLPQPGAHYGMGAGNSNGNASATPGYMQPTYAPGNANQTPVPLPTQGSVVTDPGPIPQPGNNVNGSPNNTSPTASTYPTTNSVPLDTLPTPSTTPATSGIVDAPNPPTAGSDTEKLMQGVNSNMPGTTNISPGTTAADTMPGATNTAAPAAAGISQPGTSTPGGPLTPEQVYQQLQGMRQAQSGQQQPQPPTAPAPQ